MKIVITIDESNAAFEGNGAEETRRILGKFVKDFPAYYRGDKENLIDINGNAVGTVEITEQD